LVPPALWIRCRRAWRDLFLANVSRASRALLASRLAARIGLIRTMVFTHLPSNILLILSR